MKVYYFELIQEGEEGRNKSAKHFRLYVTVDDLYYWYIEFYFNEVTKSVTLETFHSGFISDEIKEKIETIPEISPIYFKERFGSFAYFVERAVNGFVSYIMWIKPDPQTITIPWQISVE